MIMNDLLQIQTGLGSFGRDPRPRHITDDDLEEDELKQVTKDLYFLPVTSNLYHKGYTTKHWLSVFRDSKANGHSLNL